VIREAGFKNVVIKTVVYACVMHVHKCFACDKQDFGNDGFFEDVTIEPPGPDITGTMIPPTVDSDHNVTVHFDPLPHPSDLRLHRLPPSGSDPAVMNTSQLRPKIAQISHDKVESDDEGDALTNDMLLLQERVKLEKLLCE